MDNIGEKAVRSNCGICDLEIVDAGELYWRVHASCLRQTTQLAATYRAQHDSYEQMRADFNRIALFLRENYGWEIRDGKHDRQTLSETLIMYLRMERSRPLTRLVNFFRSLARWLGHQ